MKVLQITTHFNIGGISNYILTLSGAMKKKGVDCLVVSGGGNLEGELKKAGVGHITLDINTKSELSPKVFRAIIPLCKIVKREKVDIIHAHSRVSQVAAFFTSLITGVPYVTTCHGFFRKRLRKIFDTWGRKVVAISDAVSEHLKKDLGVSADRIELIYSGVDADKFSRKLSPEEMGVIKRSLGLKNGPLIGAVGRLSPVKGQEFLIMAMPSVIKKFPDAQCIIVGDGNDKAHLKNLALTLKLNGSVLFIPSEPDMAKFLSIIDVFVFPSVKEGLGIALLEALAAGKACVASRIGGIENIVKNRYNGILVDVGDVISIGEAIMEFLGDAELKREMGERGRELVKEKFSLDAMSEKMIELYGKVESGASK